MLQKVILSLCFIFPLWLTAQDAIPQRFKAGITAGFNASQINGDASAGFNKLGLVAGLRAATIINEKIDISIELLFSQRGSRSELFNSTNTNIPFKINLNYIEVPLIFNIGDWLSDDEQYYRLNFHAGFSYGNLFSTKIEDDNTNLLQVGEFFKKTDISWLAGFTYFINKNVGVTVRYSRSITPLYKAQTSFPFQSAMIGHFFSVRALYML